MPALLDAVLSPLGTLVSQLPLILLGLLAAGTVALVVRAGYELSRPWRFGSRPAATPPVRWLLLGSLLLVGAPGFALWLVGGTPRSPSSIEIIYGTLRWIVEGVGAICAARGLLQLVLAVVEQEERVLARPWRESRLSVVVPVLTIAFVVIGTWRTPSLPIVGDARDALSPFHLLGRSGGSQ